MSEYRHSGRPHEFPIEPTRDLRPIDFTPLLTFAAIFAGIGFAMGFAVLWGVAG